VVIGVGAAGLVLAALLALTPWSAGEHPYPHVTRLDTPVATAPRG
jgi:hypothetical protein